jgi:hypothetical protein
VVVEFEYFQPVLPDGDYAANTNTATGNAASGNTTSWFTGYTRTFTYSGYGRQWSARRR